MHFDKRWCYVLKENEECIIIGTRIIDNCYEMNTIVETIKVHNKELWHQRLGHVNYKFLNKLGNKGIVWVIPTFKKENKLICGDFQMGKLTRVKHVHLGDITTTHVWGIPTQGLEI